MRPGPRPGHDRPRTPRPAGARRSTRSPLLAAQVAVAGGGGEPLAGEPAGELLGNGHAAVLAARAADGEREVPLALPPVAGDEQAEHVGVAVEELLGVGLAQHELADVG